MGAAQRARAAVGAPLWARPEERSAAAPRGGRPSGHSTAPWPRLGSALSAPTRLRSRRRPPPASPGRPAAVTARCAVRALFNVCAPRTAGARDPRPAWGAQIQRRAPVTLLNR